MNIIKNHLEMTKEAALGQMLEAKKEDKFFYFTCIHKGEKSYFIRCSKEGDVTGHKAFNNLELCENYLVLSLLDQNEEFKICSFKDFSWLSHPYDEVAMMLVKYNNVDSLLLKYASEEITNIYSELQNKNDNYQLHLLLKAFSEWLENKNSVTSFSYSIALEEEPKEEENILDISHRFKSKKERLLLPFEFSEKNLEIYISRASHFGASPLDFVAEVTVLFDAKKLKAYLENKEMGNIVYQLSAHLQNLGFNEREPHISGKENRASKGIKKLKFNYYFFGQEKAYSYGYEAKHFTSFPSSKSEIENRRAKYQAALDSFNAEHLVLQRQVKESKNPDMSWKNLVQPKWAGLLKKYEDKGFYFYISFSGKSLY